MDRRALAAVPLLLAAACTSPTGQPTDAPAASEPSASATAFTLPAQGPPCVLEAGGRETGLTEDEAVEVTGLAASALERREPVGFLTVRLEPFLDARPRPAARSLLGYAEPALTCDYLRPDLSEERMQRSGLTPRAERLRRQVRRAFGDLPMGGFASGGVTTGHTDNSSHYDGRAIDIFVRPHQDRTQARRGWVLAQWLVARGGRLDVLSVIYRDRIWTIWASFAGWRDYVHPSGNTDDPVLRHLDHVHAAVLGGPFIDDERRDD